jgi:hypothetical protein
MTGAVNIGSGRCHASVRLLIKPVRAVIELGALQDVLSATLNCVHHANRTGDAADFIAVALPQMCKGRNAMRLGHEIELIGSVASLSRLNAMDGIVTLRRRGMIKAIEISETWADPGAPGAAYVRDRTCEKSTTGWMRRAAARAERRGKLMGKSQKPAGDRGKSTLALFYGNAVVHVREVIGNTSEDTLLVSTYGFSSPIAPAILPVRPDSLGLATDAA